MAALIQVPFPHIALNSHDVPSPDYLMAHTWKVAKNIPVDHITDFIKKVILGRPEKQINTLIINAHGKPGHIRLGQGIGIADLHKFQIWKTEKGPLIKEIWIVACRVASETKSASGGPSGEQFCRDLALATGSLVTAAVRQQRVEVDSLPVGCIDEWEGEIFTFDSNGNKTVRQQDNASWND